jgi:uncharacterized protein (DUF1778 family)
MAPALSRSKSVSRSRAERLEARVSREQKALFQRAAEMQGRTLTDFIVASAQAAALRTIEELQIIRLNAEESRAFADALLNPREPNKKLRDAARRYSEIIGR